ncbi:DUF1192 domain-containing protein [Martelella endophytica]|uniref:DUF1192 domain-containing protein n=1 Tax=Martelella endophytica TaxID=1486262 RepID=A0A0D5LRJ0_MAREN|nr:DUF1192 domain-containing protein [Martelella endophytica]AJY46357.1 hypothetical protein TM49_12835 [Martelella endophytica]
MPRDEEEDRKPPKGQYIIGADLEEHSVEALNSFVGDLRREIERVEEAIARKGKGRSAAESFFRK